MIFSHDPRADVVPIADTLPNLMRLGNITQPSRFDGNGGSLVSPHGDNEIALLDG